MNCLGCLVCMFCAQDAGSSWGGLLDVGVL